MPESPHGVDAFPSIGSPNDEDLFWQRNWTGVLQAITAGLIAVITAAYTYVEVLQWEAIRESVEVSRAAAEAAKKSADLALSETRAWLSVQFFEISGQLSATEPRTLRVRVFNSGKTPAFRVGYALETALAGDEADLAQLEPPAPPTETEYAIPPGSPFGALAIPFDPIPQNNLALYHARRQHFYVRLTLHYEDIAGVKHTTETCGYHTSGTGLREGFTACRGFQKMD